MLRRAPLFGGKNRVTFSLPAHEPDGQVSVVGDFNSWEPGRHEMVRRRNGTRSVSIVLPPGEYRFRYLATTGVWLDDETADHVDADGSWVRVEARVLTKNRR
jgi:1,4-alpha-glucan branching enzyme